MKILCSLSFLFIFHFAWAVQKAKIVSPNVEIYSDSDFDSQIISNVHEGDSYFISDKTYGPFYKIKLKNGKIGYIVDYELDIEGKGRFKERDLDDIIYEQISQMADEPRTTAEDEAEEAQVFGHIYSGPTLQLINYHENTLGADQVDDLLAIGYKRVGDGAWSVVAALKAPKYYADRTGGSARGLNVWADYGFSNTVANLGRSDIRFAGTLFTHVSLIQVETADRKYDLHDVTVGVALELGWLIKFKKSVFDMSVKYYFDKTNYAGFGLSYLF